MLYNSTVTYNSNAANAKFGTTTCTHNHQQNYKLKRPALAIKIVIKFQDEAHLHDFVVFGTAPIPGAPSVPEVGYLAIGIPPGNPNGMPPTT
jgi:hypothetical protein